MRAQISTSFSVPGIDFIRQNLMTRSSTNTDSRRSLGGPAGELGPYNESVGNAIKNLKAYTLKENVSLTSIVRSGVAQEGDVDGIDIGNRNITTSRTYDVFTVPLVEKEVEIKLEDYISSTHPHIAIASRYNSSFSFRLKKEMMEDVAYRTLFEYVFPLDRFMSLITIYTIEHVSGLPGREVLFDGTKDMLRTLFYSISTSSDDDWWVQKKKKKKEWWEKPLELSLPGILFMTPWKILEALLMLVPPLKWFLDMIKIPKLPPRKSKKKDPCA